MRELGDLEPFFEVRRLLHPYAHDAVDPWIPLFAVRVGTRRADGMGLARIDDDELDAPCVVARNLLHPVPSISIDGTRVAAELKHQRPLSEEVTQLGRGAVECGELEAGS
ncbi:MAG: hypothetical protein AAGA81_15990 [Acidobacteriota bacterium]